MSQDLISLDWKQILQPEKMDANLAFNNFYEALQPIIDKYIPLEKVKKNDHKRRYKPWITLGIRTSMRKRDKLLHLYMKEKNPTQKSSLHYEYKSLRNSIVELTKKSKLNYYNSYFTANNNNLRKVWNGIKDIINIKNKTNDTPTCFTDDNGNAVTDPVQISNTFCKQFSTVADKILEKRAYEGDGELFKVPSLL